MPPTNPDALSPRSRNPGVCETTLTERFFVADCACDTYPDNLGPCAEFSPDGTNGKCPYCDHTEACHAKR
jgi:hypothetical protein